MEQRELEALQQRLVKIRGKRSQRAFARDLGVFQQNVNRYESGTVPHLDFLIVLAAKEGVDLHWLITGKRLRRKSGGGSAPSRPR